MRPPSPPRPLAFPTLDSLAAFLGSRLPASALASWGTAPGTKTLLNLFLELSQGECVLISAATAPAAPQHPVVRAVHIASVRIRNSRGALLMETGQLLSDGTLRSRGGLRPLSEKMRPGETPEAAAVRAVREELGERVRVRILGGEEARVEERESASYPGLHARYVLHAVDAEVVEGIPEEGEFDTEEGGEHEDKVVVEGAAAAITVKRHYWKWVDDNDNEEDVAGGGGDGAEEGARQSAH
uniref:Nudix hydrolase domain-containing protein n=1 Tax=Oryza punctata TaxID=4537 RepID=A0A0E0LFJ8_ORYPU